jgi:ectoine hydroxylase-related dioxygenase (phytanoyl-CoA dioxygenase family)/predicted O-methyltransferase YrrM
MKDFVSNVRSVIDAYERDGFAVSRALLSPVETEALRSRLGGNKALAAPGSESIASDKALQRALIENRDSAALLRQVASSSRVLPVVQHFQARPFVEHTKVLAKLGGAPATPWHQDAAYWHSFDPRLSMMTLWIALGHTDANNGCLRVARVKSSDSLLPHELIDERRQYVLSDDVARRHFADHELVDLEVEPGDGVFLSCRAVHGAHPNRGVDPRFAFKLVFQDHAQRAPAVPRHQTSMEIGIALDEPGAPSAARSHGQAREYPPPPREGWLRRAKKAVPRRLLKQLRTRLAPAAPPPRYTDVFPHLRRLQLSGSEREWKLLLYLAELLDQLEDVPGDIAEFGVAGGVSLITMARVLRIREQGREGRARRTLYGFDSFEGLPSLAAEDVAAFVSNPEMRKGGFCDPVAQADLFRFVDADGGIRLLQGWFHETLPRFLRESPHACFALVHIDCDLYESTKVVLEQIWGSVAVGGLVVFDELFDKDFPGESLAFREWAPGKSFTLKTSRVRREMKYLVKTGY